MTIPTEIWEQYSFTLIQLAKRNNPDAKNWCFNSEHYIKCRLCDELIWEGCSDLKAGSKAIMEHGIQHLKDLNLLPFT